MKRRSTPVRRRTAGAIPGTALEGGAHADSARPDSFTDHPILTTVAGYRVLRRLSSAQNADTFLAHAGGDDPDGVVAVTVFRDDADRAAIDREVGAMSRAPGGCLPRLIDIATLADGRVALVVERLAGGTLGSLLTGRADLEPGEAVTILAPVVVAVRALHDIGFAHTGLGQGTVVFSADGRPVLTGLQGLCDLPPYGARGRAAGAGSAGRLDLIREDYARLTALMRSVFQHLDGSSAASRRSEAIAAWFEGATSAVPFAPCLDALERRLFEWAPALSVPLQREGPAAVGTVPARVGLLAASAEGPGETGARRLRRERERRPAARIQDRPPPAWFDVLHLPGDLAQTVVDAVDRSRWAAFLRRARAGVRARRRVLVVAACMAAGAAAVGLAVIPGGSDSAAPVVREGARNAPGETRASHDGASGRAVHDVPSPAAGEASAIAGDDPVVAVPHLLTARAACLAAESVACLSGVDQAGSPIMHADTYSIGFARDGGPSDADTNAGAATGLTGTPATLIERTGNWALVTVVPGNDEPDAEPASLLVVKGEAGWRLREILGPFGE